MYPAPAGQPHTKYAKTHKCRQCRNVKKYIRSTLRYTSTGGMLAIARAIGVDDVSDIYVSANPAAALAEALAAHVSEARDYRIAVSGGSTPRELFHLLASTYRNRISWERVNLFQVDERCVPATDPQSNWKMLQEELLSKLPGIAAYRMEAERPNAADDYESIIRRRVPANAQGVPRFDVVLLGMGADGHTASLFPGTRALEECSRLVVLNDVSQLNTKRVTMTFPLLNAAANRWFLVRGNDKAQAFQQAQQGLVPASRILDPHWYIDASVHQPS